jgi:hypothetical protein
LPGTAEKRSGNLWAGVTRGFQSDELQMNAED